MSRTATRRLAHRKASPKVALPLFANVIDLATGVLATATAPLVTIAFRSRFKGRALRATTFSGIPFDALLRQTREEINELYSSGDCTLLKSGDIDGIFAPRTGHPENLALAIALRALWNGKHVIAEDDRMFNYMLGRRCLSCSLYVAPSHFDGKDAIIADYGRVRLPLIRLKLLESLKIRSRNEFRRVGEGLYLGRTYWEVAGKAYFGADFLLIEADGG